MWHEPHIGGYTHPVMKRKTPTPPIQPTRICLGKKPMRLPSLKTPSSRKVRPVRRDDSAKATSVVAMIASGGPPEAEMISSMDCARM